MEYPKDFPIEAEARVESEKILAEQMFDASKAIFIREYEKDKDRRFVTALLIDCILRVFAAFGKEACDLGKSGAWTASAVDEHAREFLRGLSREFARERGFDNFGNALPDLLSDGDVSLEFENGLRQSSTWLDFQKARRWVAVRQAFPADLSVIHEIPKTQQPTTANSDRCLRSAQVDEFLDRCNLKSRDRIRRKHIWLAVGHTKGRQFEYWQVCDSVHTTGEDERNFARILNTEPSAFVALLRQKDILPRSE